MLLQLLRGSWNLHILSTLNKDSTSPPRTTDVLGSWHSTRSRRAVVGGCAAKEEQLERSGCVAPHDKSLGVCLFDITMAQEETSIFRWGRLDSWKVSRIELRQMSASIIGGHADGRRRLIGRAFYWVGHAMPVLHGLGE
mmetsp:Transcript_8427/g.17512  ORF Transcript_8427/g.17512 Transcript_8427/m.17512 type:complete len:139 (-) Transcript_8427:760-1176(-)